ncbi:MAG TPA: Yip1 family protein [Gemmatimonadaceae bacterium]|nr:Yip1 family protein [Gemmatimonadaceae bacterium]
MEMIPRRSIVDRMKGAAMLDVPTYEEVEADETATGQAAVVVVIAAVAAAIGGITRGAPGIIGGLASALVGWIVWSGVTYFIGTKLFGGTATWGELLRTLGFAQAPGILLILGILPVLGGFVWMAVSIWTLIAGVIAIRQALDFSTAKALLTGFIGWLALLIPRAIFGF